MKARIIYSLSVAAIAAFASCSDFLEPYPNATRDLDYVLSNPKNLEGLVGRCYDYLSTNYNDNEGAYLDCLTDNAVLTSRTSALGLMATGVTNPANDLFATYWTRDYNALYNLNLFLKDGNGRKIRYLSDARRDSLLVNRLWGEAYGLRAWFEWDLLQKFGGRSTDGRLLGFPILTEPLDIGNMSAEELSGITIERNTYDECVAQILADCDSAYRYLPLAHRDFLVSDPADLTVLGSLNWGRIDGISTRAIKAMVYLTWASPRFNPAGDTDRWLKAAECAKEVIDFKLTVDKVTDGFKAGNAENWFNPNDPGIVWSLYTSSSSSMEKMFWPGAYQGNGEMGPTQEFVNCFAMADGYPAGESPVYAYDPQDPYADREPRFYSTVFYNGLTVVTGNNKKNYKFEMFEGGKDAPGASSKNSLTGYYIKKFVYTGLNWTDSRQSVMPHYKAFIRWTDMVLCFAEAANNAVGPLGEIGGLSARAAIGYLRSRKTTDGADGFYEDPYLDYISLCGSRKFDMFLRGERRKETCFEGKWFYDLRRWSTNLGELNVQITRPSITMDSNRTVTTYGYGIPVEKRVFTSAYLPIPYNEMLKVSGLVQNEGWEAWE